MNVRPAVYGIGRHDLATLVARLQERQRLRRRRHVAVKGLSGQAVATRTPVAGPKDVISYDR
jgi:hypothetical protein